MPNATIQEFAGKVATIGDEPVVKWANTLYPGEVTDIDTETDTPIITITEDAVGTHSGWTFVDCEREDRENQPDMSWFWKFPPVV